MLAPGETVALVGPSGGGKSTLASLLCLFRAPAAGRILVGDQDLAACDPAAWRSQIAWLPQSPTLFRGTVADNIRLGDRRRRPSACARRRCQAGADAFIAGLPDGYDTVVGEGGRQLSTGEAQRIGLARAFLRDAPLVVLDEPTANLDPAAARVVAEAVERLRPGRTMLLIAHDAELAAHADRSVTIAAGRIEAARA